jgi:hypothetical protein
VNGLNRLADNHGGFRQNAALFKLPGFSNDLPTAVMSVQQIKIAFALL